MAVYRDLMRVPKLPTIYVAAFFARLPMMAFPLALTLLVVEGLGRSYTEAGLVAAAETLGVAAGGPWRGRRIDAQGLRRALVPSIVAVAVLYPLIATSSYLMLLPLAFLAGVFLIPIYSVVRLSLSVLVPQEQRRTAFSLDSVVAEASFIIGPALAGIIVIQVSPSAAIFMVGACNVLAGVMFFVLNPPTRTLGPMEPEPAEPLAPQEAITANEAGALTRRRMDWFTVDHLFLFFVSGGSMIALMATDLSIIAALREQDSLDWLWIAYFGWGFSSLIGGVLYGAHHRSLRPSYLLLVMGLATIPAGLAGTPWLLALAVVPAGFLCAPVMTAASEVIADLTAEDRRGEAMGWQGTSFTVGGALAGPAIGATLDAFGAASGFAIGGGVAAAIAAFVIVAQARPRKPSSTRSISTSR